ncbi:acyl-CoA dehydrogenase family protein [Streptomyces sp. PU-14G]|uniref:acyl-CoA dehydrogenase family protein n=1 Tax=Streptomyces sp. PU-14G TaxID=2800808 RepID=UPI0034DE29AB
MRTLATERLRPHAEAGDPGRVNRPLLRELGARGLLAHAVPGARARERVSALDLCLLREALAYSCPQAETALALQGLGAGPVADVGTDEQRARWLPAVAAGRAVAAFALSEPGAGSDAAALALRAEPEPGHAPESPGTAPEPPGAESEPPGAAPEPLGAESEPGAGPEGGGGARGARRWRLTGRKTWISNAPEADFYTVFARTGEGPGSRGVSAFLVPADRPGLTGEPLDMLAPHALGTLTFDAVPVTGADLLGAPGQGFSVAMRTLNLFRPSVGAFAVGMAQAALDASLQHAAERPAFGGVLRDLQTVSHQLAEMATRTEAARLLVYAAAGAYDASAGTGGDVARRAAMAKLMATETAQYVVDTAVQIHGAAALQRGHLLEHLYREVRAPRIYEGASEVQRSLIAKELYRARLPRTGRPHTKETHT